MISMFSLVSLSANAGLLETRVGLHTDWVKSEQEGVELPDPSRFGVGLSGIARVFPIPLVGVHLEGNASFGMDGEAAGHRGQYAWRAQVVSGPHARLGPLTVAARGRLGMSWSEMGLHYEDGALPSVEYPSLTAFSLSAEVDVSAPKFNARLSGTMGLRDLKAVHETRVDLLVGYKIVGPLVVQVGLDNVLQRAVLSDPNGLAADLRDRHFLFDIGLGLRL